MEELGIGRPSTYASVLSVLRDRQYVTIDKNRFIPEDKGRIVTCFLEDHFKKYVEYDFTADLEEKLDLVSNSELAYKDVLKILRKNNPEKADFYKDTSFSELALKRVNYSFFANTLKLKDDEIKLFLVFCENDSKSRSLMAPSNQFQLIDFLISKNKEYKRITTFEK